MDNLTSRQRQVYDFIVRAIEEDGFAPTLQEIATHLGVKGNLGVLRHLAALEKKGFLHRSAGRSRGIVPVRRSASKTLPLVGSVAAGPLTEAVEHIEGYFNVDSSLVKGDDSFLLRVRGDSMIEAHIADGDLAVVRPQKSAENGEIVVVMVDGDVTLKRFFRERGCVRLQPENAALQPILLSPRDGEVVVVGRVTGIVRRLDC